jgi:hypothetical protein
MNNRENPYKEWGMWGGIFTALSVAATIAFSAFGIAFGWPLAVAILGALFTAVVVAATYSHEKTSERNEVLTERRKHDKELAKQQEIEKQIQQDEARARQTQMKEEEAKMEEAMNVVRNKGWIIDNRSLQNVPARNYISQLLNEHNIVKETNNFTVSSLRSKIAGTHIGGSFTVGFAKNGKIATIDIDGTKIYNKGR